MSIEGLANATLNTIAKVAAADSRGGLSWATAVTLDQRIMLGRPERRHEKLLGTQLTDIQAVAYVPYTLSGGVQIAEQDRLAITLDGSAQITYEVAMVGSLVAMSPLSHFECFLKVAR